MEAEQMVKLCLFHTYLPACKSPAGPGAVPHSAVSAAPQTPNPTQPRQQQQRHHVHCTYPSTGHAEPPGAPRYTRNGPGCPQGMGVLRVSGNWKCQGPWEDRRGGKDGVPALGGPRTQRRCEGSRVPAAHPQGCAGEWASPPGDLSRSSHGREGRFCGKMLQGLAGRKFPQRSRHRARAPPWQVQGLHK